MGLNNLFSEQAAHPNEAPEQRDEFRKGSDEPRVAATTSAKKQTEARVRT
jgi:hypothetical protein